MSTTAFDNLTTAVLLLDHSLNVIQLNQSAESLFDLSEKRAINKKSVSYTHLTLPTIYSV